MKLKDNQKRDILGEGRNYGMGFSICKKIDNDTIETIIPITACKDYLNDVIYNELTGKKIKAYGCELTKKSNILDDNYIYMVLKILPYQGGGKYPNYDIDSEYLENNIDNLISFINYFEDELEIKKTKILKSEDNEIKIIKLDKYWAQTTYLISLYSLLLRVGLYYEEGDPLNYLKNFSKRPEETYIIKAALPKLQKLLNVKKIDPQNFIRLMDRDIHNYGIVGCNEL